MNEEGHLPEFLRPLFWDVDFDRLHIPGHEQYIIERILELGDAAEVRWMFQNFPREQIIQALRRGRSLSRKSAIFWASMFHVSRRSIRCLSRHSRQSFGPIWPW
ncbi:MAG: DUF6922 domain-containing protein [Anaerolineae bacterium]|jgi:hypothetical protein